MPWHRVERFDETVRGGVAPAASALGMAAIHHRDPAETVAARHRFGPLAWRGSQTTRAGARPCRAVTPAE